MASGVNQTELVIFLFMVVSVPIIILALCNILRIQEWYDNVRGRVSREPQADASEYVEDVMELRREEEEQG
jgi:hypothetical protein